MVPIIIFVLFALMIVCIFYQMLQIKSHEDIRRILDVQVTDLKARLESSYKLNSINTAKIYAYEEALKTEIKISKES